MQTAHMSRTLEILNRLDCPLPEDAKILDFGCGEGTNVYQLHDLGFKNAVGFDVMNILNLRKPEDDAVFNIGYDAQGRLPYEDASIDFIFSQEVFEHVQDQIPVWKELRRILKPNAGAMHVFPAPYGIIEQHNYVPLGGVIPHYWWYWIWAKLGIRNEFQQGLSADKTARWNAFRYIENLNYVNNSCYKVIWEELGFEWRWAEQESFDTNASPKVRLAGKFNRVIPLLGWVCRTFVTRRVFMRRLPGEVELATSGTELSPVERARMT